MQHQQQATPTDVRAALGGSAGKQQQQVPRMWSIVEQPQLLLQQQAMTAAVGCVEEGPGSGSSVGRLLRVVFD